MKKNKNAFNGYQFGQKHTAIPKKGYTGPYMNEFGENIYDEVEQNDLEFSTKHKKVDTTKKTTKSGSKGSVGKK